MKSKLDKEGLLAQAAFGLAVGKVPSRMPSEDAICLIVNKVPVTGEFKKKKSWSHSAMPLAVALVLALVLPAFFVDKTDSLSSVSAQAAGNGSLKRVGETALLALGEGSRSFGFRN